MKSLINKILSLPELRDDPPVLIDIGASRQIHKKWRLFSKHSICIAFDADEREFGFIKKEHSNFKKLFVYNCIVSNENKSDQQFYLTQSPYCSSILKPDIKNLENYSYADIFRTVKIKSLKTISLSSALSELNIKKIDWFKSDSQGLDLRLFLDINEETRKKIIVAEFEPGLIDAYKNEDKLYSFLEYFQNKNFWFSDLIIKGVPRISSKLFSSIYSNQKLAKLLSLSIKQSPGWAEITLINSFNNGILFTKREYLLGCLFAIIEKQFGFAYELSLKGYHKFEDPIFDDISKKSLETMKRQLYKLKFLPAALKRIKELTFG